MRVSLVPLLCVVLCLAAGGCRRSPTGSTSSADSAGDRTSGVVVAIPGDVVVATDVPQEAVPVEASPAADVPAATVEADVTAQDTGEASDALPEAAAAEDALPPGPPDPSCPQPLPVEDYAALESRLGNLLLAPYGLDAWTEDMRGGLDLRVIPAGEGGVLIAALYGINRFAVWSAQLEQRGEWEAMQARYDAAVERLVRKEHRECLAAAPAGDPEGTCAYVLEDRGDSEPDTFLWEDLTPGKFSPPCCITDSLHAAIFSGRLDEAGKVDPASLRLEKTATVKDDCCNASSTAAFIVADLDYDGALELLLELGEDEHDGQPYVVQPFDILVLRTDLTVQHRFHDDGIVVNGGDEPPATVRDHWYRFEDRTGDDRPDLVIEAFDLGLDCRELSPEMHLSLPPVEGEDWDLLAEEELPTDCFGNEQHRPRPHPPSEYAPECVRQNIQAEVFAYDAVRDEWRAAGRRGLQPR
jgi:hypothetical protein